MEARGRGAARAEGYSSRQGISAEAPVLRLGDPALRLAALRCKQVKMPRRRGGGGRPSPAGKNQRQRSPALKPKAPSKRQTSRDSPAKVTKSKDLSRPSTGPDAPESKFGAHPFKSPAAPEQESRSKRRHVELDKISCGYNSDDQEQPLSSLRAASVKKKRKRSVTSAQTAARKNPGTSSNRDASRGKKENTSSVSHGKEDRREREPCGAAEFCLNLHDETFNLRPAHKCHCCKVPVHNLCCQAAGLDENVFGCLKVITKHWEHKNKKLTPTLVFEKVGSVEVLRFVAKTNEFSSALESNSVGSDLEEGDGADLMQRFTSAILKNARIWLKERTKRDFPDLKSLKTCMARILKRQGNVVKDYRQALAALFTEANILENTDDSLQLQFRGKLRSGLHAIFTSVSEGADSQEDTASTPQRRSFLESAQKAFGQGNAKAVHPNLFPGFYENKARLLVTQAGSDYAAYLCCIAPFLLAGDTGRLLFAESESETVQKRAEAWCDKAAALTRAIEKADDHASEGRASEGVDRRGRKWKGKDMTNFAARLVEAVLAPEHKELREDIFESRNRRDGQQAAKGLRMDRQGSFHKLAAIINGDLLVERRELPGTGGTRPSFVPIDNSMQKTPFRPDNIYKDDFPDIDPSALPPSSIRVDNLLVRSTLRYLKSRVSVAYRHVVRSGQHSRDSALFFAEKVSDDEEGLDARGGLNGADVCIHSQSAGSGDGEWKETTSSRRTENVAAFQRSTKFNGPEFRSDLISYILQIAFDPGEPSRQALTRQIFALVFPRRSSSRRKDFPRPRQPRDRSETDLSEAVQQACRAMNEISQRSLSITPSSAGQLEMSRRHMQVSELNAVIGVTQLCIQIMDRSDDSRFAPASELASSILTRAVHRSEKLLESINDEVPLNRGTNSIDIAGGPSSFEGSAMGLSVPESESESESE